MEDLKFERRYNMSELFFKESEETLAWVIFWFSMTNFVMSCITLVIIVTQTPATMKSFRNLLFALLFVQTLYEIFNVFYKPATLLPLPIFIPVNPIPGMTNTLNFFGPYISMIYETIILDLLLCMVIQRYFTMSKNAIAHPRHLEKCIYGIVVFTNFIMIAIIIISNFIGDRLNERDTIIFIQKYIIDWEKLLGIIKNPFVITVFQRSDPLAYFEKYYTGFYAISRLFAFFIFTRLNMKIIFGTNETSQNQKQHQMIIRLLKFEFLAVIFLIIFPANLLIFAVALKIPHPMIPMYCELLLKLYPPVDMLLTAFLIKPYRKFVTKVIFKICRMKFSNVNDGSTPKMNVAKNVAQTPI